MILIENYQIELILLTVCWAITTILIVKSNQSWISKVYKKILAENPGIASGESFSVNYSSNPPRIFDQFRRHQAGIMAVSNGNICFYGYNSSFEPVKVKFSLNSIEPEWVGKMALIGRNYWFRFKNGDGVHYFSAELGETFSNNESETKLIYEKLEKLIK